MFSGNNPAKHETKARLKPVLSAPGMLKLVMLQANLARTPFIPAQCFWLSFTEDLAPEVCRGSVGQWCSDKDEHGFCLPESFVGNKARASHHEVGYHHHHGVRECHMATSWQENPGWFGFCQFFPHLPRCLCRKCLLLLGVQPVFLSVTRNVSWLLLIQTSYTRAQGLLSSLCSWRRKINTSRGQ